MQYLTLVFPALIIVVGWAVGHKLSFAREVAAKRRETRVKVLEAAFLALNLCIDRKRTPEMDRALESAVASLQLYGSLEQLKLVDKFVVGMIQPGARVELTSLMVNLRDSIRSELKLDSTSAGVAWMRLDPSTKAPRKLVRKTSGLLR